MQLIFPIITIWCVLKMLNAVQETYARIPRTYPRRKACLWLCLLVSMPMLGWPMIQIASSMMFDAPGSEREPMLWLLYILLTSYPILFTALNMLIVRIGLRRSAKQKHEE